MIVLVSLIVLLKGFPCFHDFSHGASHPYIPIHSIEFLHLLYKKLRIMYIHVCECMHVWELCDSLVGSSTWTLFHGNCYIKLYLLFQRHFSTAHAVISAVFNILHMYNIHITDSMCYLQNTYIRIILTVCSWIQE